MECWLVVLSALLNSYWMHLVLALRIRLKPHDLLRQQAPIFGNVAPKHPSITFKNTILQLEHCGIVCITNCGLWTFTAPGCDLRDGPAIDLNCEWLIESMHDGEW